MSLMYPIFYFGVDIKDDALFLDIEDSSNITYSIRLPLGRFSPRAMCAILEANIISQTGLVALCSFNYVTQRFTLTFEETVTLLGNTGANKEVSALPALGFALADLTGDVLTSSVNAGMRFLPNFALENFVDKENFVTFFGRTESESASLAREVVTFGERKKYQYALRYLNDKQMTVDSALKVNVNALKEAREYLKNLQIGGSFDFFLSRDSVTAEAVPDDVLIAEVGTQNFRLLEMIDEDLPTFFRIDAMTFDVLSLSPLGSVTPEEISRLLLETGDLILLETGGAILI